MKARLTIATGLVALMMGTVACSKNDSKRVAPDAGSSGGEEEKVVSYDCSNFIGEWKLQDPLKDKKSELSSLEFTEDEGVLSFSIPKQKEPYILDGESRDYEYVEAKGSCTNNGMLVMSHRKNVLPNLPWTRWVFVKNTAYESTLTLQKVSTDKDGVETVEDLSVTRLQKVDEISTEQPAYAGSPSEVRL